MEYGKKYSRKNFKNKNTKHFYVLNQIFNKKNVKEN